MSGFCNHNYTNLRHAKSARRADAADILGTVHICMYAHTCTCTCTCLPALPLVVCFVHISVVLISCS